MRRFGLGTIVALFACTVREPLGATPAEPMTVMHAVMDPDAEQLLVLLERTWTGRSETWSGGEEFYDRFDPVLTGGGIPEAGASVFATFSDGRTYHANELVWPGDSIGRGLYLLGFNGDDLAPGIAVTLEATTAAGEVLMATTTMPHRDSVIERPTTVFRRNRDTLRLDWNPVDGARAYEVRVQNSFTNVRVFTESTFVALTGGLRDVTTTGLPLVFQPGDPYLLSVLAVDSNYFEYYRRSGSDYYRSNSDGTIGPPSSSRVKGGLGVVGSVALILFQRVFVPNL